MKVESGAWEEESREKGGRKAGPPMGGRKEQRRGKNREEGAESDHWGHRLGKSRKILRGGISGIPP